MLEARQEGRVPVTGNVTRTRRCNEDLTGVASDRVGRAHRHGTDIAAERRSHPPDRETSPTTDPAAAMADEDLGVAQTRDEGSDTRRVGLVPSTHT